MHSPAKKQKIDIYKMVGMDDRHRKLLRSNRVALIRDLDGDRVSSYLYSYDIFSEEDKDVVGAEATPRQKNEKLLDLLQKRGENAFKVFCDVLKELKFSHLEILLRVEDRIENASYFGSGKSATSSVDGAVEHGVIEMDSEERPDNQVVDGRAGEDSSDGRFFNNKPKEDAESKPSIYPDAPTTRVSDFKIDSTFYYPMDTHPRGLMIILNNKDFLPASGMDEYPRNGTDVDAEAFEKLFVELGFIVHPFRNISCYEIRKILKQASVMDHSKHSCFGCCILSHGQEGVIYGTDGVVDIREVTNYFAKSTTLVGKPKLFFFQACQGSDYMDGMDAPDGPVAMQLSEANSITLPSESDFLYAYSTVPGFYSWRNSSRGSWFIQAIVEVFREYAHKLDLLRMLTRVNAIVATKKSQTGQKPSNNKRQMASIVTQLRKELFFFPPKGPLQSS